MTELRTRENNNNLLVSKVTTKINWCIQLNTFRKMNVTYAIIGKWDSISHERNLKDFKEKRVETFAYTYKEDFNEMVKVLKANDIQIFEK